jgi:hypothetical protein
MNPEEITRLIGQMETDIEALQRVRAMMLRNGDSPEAVEAGKKPGRRNHGVKALVLDVIRMSPDGLSRDALARVLMREFQFPSLQVAGKNLDALLHKAFHSGHVERVRRDNAPQLYRWKRP